MKVAFDSRPMSDPNDVGRYSRCLSRALRETRSEEDELLETPRPSVTVRAREHDLFHSPWMGGAMLHSPCPMVVTLHDLAPLKRRSDTLRTSLRLRHLAVQRALGVIVPTRAVAEDAITHLRLQRSRVSVIAEAPDACMYPRDAHEIEAARERLKLPERYLIWVGGLQRPDPARHVAKLAAAAREMPLVLVGPTRPWARELADVILAGQVSDEELAAIYCGAQALVLPSEDAGFGLSAVEALACGTPVVACDVPALREVLGDRATFVEPGDMDALVAAAEGVARPAQAPPDWTWQDAGRATWKVYAEALACA